MDAEKKQAVEEQPVLSEPEQEQNEIEQFMETREFVGYAAPVEPEPEPESQPEPTDFVIKNDGLYLVRWSANSWHKDINLARRFNKTNADYFVKEHKFEAIPI